MDWQTLTAPQRTTAKQRQALYSLLSPEATRRTIIGNLSQDEAADLIALCIRCLNPEPEPAQTSAPEINLQS